MKTLAILNCDRIQAKWVEIYGDYPAMFMTLLAPFAEEVEFEIFDVIQGEYPDAIDDVDGYLITGSRYSAYEQEPWIVRLGQFVEKLNSARKPLLGVCFGHQIIAQALGGKVEKASVGWEVGRGEYPIHVQTASMPSCKRNFSLLVSHQDQVVTLPENAEVLAGYARCPIAAYRLDRHILCIQGHPEFTPAYCRELILKRYDLIGASKADAALATLDIEHDGEWVAEWMMQFLRSCWR